MKDIVHRTPTIEFHPIFSKSHASCSFNCNEIMHLSGMGPPFAGAVVGAVHLAVSTDI